MTRDHTRPAETKRNSTETQVLVSVIYGLGLSLLNTDAQIGLNNAKHVLTETKHVLTETNRDLPIPEREGFAS